MMMTKKSSTPKTFWDAVEKLMAAQDSFLYRQYANCGKMTFNERFLYCKKNVFLDSIIIFSANWMCLFYIFYT